jgi:ribosomal protein S18 acetylase RimI-like enzyme
MGSVGDRLLQISRRETSPSYLSRSELREYVGNSNRHLYVYDRKRSDPVAELTDPNALLSTEAEVLGFAMTGVYDRQDYADIVSVSVAEVLRRTPLTDDDFPLAQFKVVAVDADHGGEGIGSALTANALTPLFEDPPVTAMIWERDNPANAKLARRYANNKLATFENYFPQDWDCPDCGYDSTCGCDVSMYGWFADDRRNTASV